MLQQGGRLPRLAKAREVSNVLVDFRGSETNHVVFRDDWSSV